MKRDILKEIKLKRVRNHEFLNDKMIICELKQFEAVIVGTTYDHKIYDYDIYQFIPVAICSAFESFFRFYIEKLIDTKKIDRRRVLEIAEIKDFKFDVLIVQELFANKISLGEIISKLTPINKMRSINVALSLLLNCDFLKELTKFKLTSNRASLNTQQNYWDENYSLILKDLNALYEVRNIVCHEFSFDISIKKTILARYLKHAIIFLERTSTFLDSLFDKRKNGSRKLSEVTLAKRSFLEVEEKLDRLLEKVSDYSKKVWYDTLYLSSNLESEVFEWRRHRRKVAKSNCWIYREAKVYNCYQYWLDMEVMTIEMNKTLESRYENLFETVERSLKIQKFV